MASEFEQASLDSQVPATRVAAEAALESFASRPDYVHFALSVVYTTNIPIARHHAARTLRLSGLARWASLPPSLRFSPTDAARIQLLTFAATHNLLAYERSVVLQAAASFAHRAYLEEPAEDRRRYFHAVCSAAAQAGAAADAQHVVTALEMLCMLVAEFVVKPPTASSFSVESEMQEQALVHFVAPGGELSMVFDAANDALSHLVTNAADRQADAVAAIARRALTTLSDVLAFNLCATAPDSAPVYAINRGPEWHGILEKCGPLTDRLFPILDAFRRDAVADASGEVMRALADVLDAAAAVTHRSYPSSDRADAFLVAALNGSESREWSAASSRQERLIYASLWRRLSTAHGLAHIRRVLPGALDSFARNTIQIFGARAVRQSCSDDAEADWSEECDCLLLEAWAELAGQAEASADPAGLQNHVASVVGEFINQRVGRGGNGQLSAGGAADDEEEDFGFDDESHEEAQIDAAAMLCRHASNACLSHLASLLDDISKRVFARQEGSSLQVLRQDQEYLVWSLRLAAAVLADEGCGETPQVPHGQTNGCQALFGALCSLAELDKSTIEHRSRDGASGEEISPRVECEILEALFRVAKTYLLPESQDEEELALRCMGGVDVATRARVLSMSRSIFGIHHRAYEAEVVTAAAKLLAELAPGRSSRRYPELCVDGTWDPLPSLGLEHFEVLPPKAIIFVGTALSHYFAESVDVCLIQPSIQQLKHLSGHQSGLADASERALAAIYILCGVARCSEAVSVVHAPILASLRVLDDVTREFTRANMSVPLACMKFAQDLVACHMPLSGSEASMRDCFVECLQLLTRALETVSVNVEETNQDDVARLVLGGLDLLQLLVDNCSGANQTFACSEAFSALGLMVPLLNDSIFAYPDLKVHFLSLVTQLTTTCPECIPALPVVFAEKVLGVVRDCAFGRCEEKVTLDGLEAVSALASFRLRRPVLSGPPSPSVVVLDLALENFLISILEGILAGGGNFKSSLDAASEALLPLMLQNEKAYGLVERAGHTLVSQSGEREQTAIAVFESMRTASREVAPVFGYFPGGDGTSVPPAERHRARKQFALAVHNLTNIARVSAVSAT